MFFDFLINIFPYLFTLIVIPFFIFYLKEKYNRSKDIIEKIYEPLSNKIERIYSDLQAFVGTYDNKEYEHIESDKLLKAEETFKKFFNKIKLLDKFINEYNDSIKRIFGYNNPIIEKNIKNIEESYKKLPDFAKSHALEPQIISLFKCFLLNKEAYSTVFYRNKEDKPVFYTINKETIEKMKKEFLESKDVNLLIEKRDKLIKAVNELKKKLENYMKHPIKSIIELLFDNMFFWFKSTKQINIERICITILFKVLIIIVLLILLSYFLASLSSTNEYLPYDSYAFAVSINTNNSDASVGRFQLFYDFSYQKGSIEFDYRNIINPNAIEIELPKSLMVINISIRNYEYGYVDKKFYNVIDYKSNIEHLRIDNFSKNITGSRVSIYFSTNNSTIYPNGRYILNIIGVKNIYFKSPEFSGGGDGNESMIFSLGKYRCLNPCLSERDNAEEKIINNNVIISSSQQNKRWIKFIISAFDESKIVDRDFVFSIISGIIVSLIFLFVTWIDHFFNWITSKI